jgi:GT2 family glycosyltransferase
VFVVLVYKNITDLKDFLRSLKNINGTYKVIVVNSHFDQKTMEEVREFSLSHNCDFVDVENKGYGYGNNCGIDYATNHYKFKFIVISNPDIVIERLSINNLNGFEDSIIGPKIITLTGKNQNPYYISKIGLTEFLKYTSAKFNTMLFLYAGVILNKINKFVRLKAGKSKKDEFKRTYALHGSFIILGNKAIEKLGKLFDERMFLFVEEEHLARLANSKGVKMYYYQDAQVLHKEDGSVSLLNKNLNKILFESYIIYYENWVFKKKKK